MRCHPGRFGHMSAKKITPQLAGGYVRGCDTTDGFEVPGSFSADSTRLIERVQQSTAFMDHVNFLGS